MGPDGGGIEIHNVNFGPMGQLGPFCTAGHPASCPPGRDNFERPQKLLDCAPAKRNSQRWTNSS